MTHTTPDLLREAAQAVLDCWDSRNWKAAPTADYMRRLRAALAAAPQPACCLCDDCPQAPNNPCGACGKAAPQLDPADREAFQNRVEPWMAACFGPEISGDRLERADRLLEEVLELLQSGDYPRERISALTGYVWSRPKGEPAQEVGGVMVTLAAYCLAHDLDMHDAGEAELARIWTKVEKIRAKQAAKPTGSALPQAWPDQPADRGALVEAIRAARCEWANDGDSESCPDQAIADALLAAGYRKADALADERARGFSPTHQHKKRGTAYELIGAACIQSDEPLEDMAVVEVYVGSDGDLWARRQSEFHDGRFEAIREAGA